MKELFTTATTVHHRALASRGRGPGVGTGREKTRPSSPGEDVLVDSTRWELAAFKVMQSVDSAGLQVMLMAVAGIWSNISEA